MKVYKRKLIGHTASDVKTYQFYRVDVTDYAFIQPVVSYNDKDVILTPFVQSHITGEFEILYVRDPYHDKYMELCGITGRVLGIYWKLIYRSI
jgi:hypothetical protein